MDDTKSAINNHRVQVIMTGFSCNNNCSVCSVRPFAANNADSKTGEIMRLMEIGRENEIDAVELTGGEPTLRRDIITLIKKAKELGYKEIALSTNARAFSYGDFLEAAVKSGLNRVTATMDGPNSKIHDAITRTPGSFEQTERGVVALLREGIEVSVNTVLCQLNVKYMDEMAEKLISLGVPTWGILDLIPDGNIAKAYPSFAVSFEDIRETLIKVYKHLDSFRLIELFDFSVCVLPREMLNNNAAVIFDAFTRSLILNHTGYDPKRFEERDGFYTDEHKIRLSGCDACLRREGCAGVWKRHVDVFGLDKDNKFISENRIIA